MEFNRCRPGGAELGLKENLERSLNAVCHRYGRMVIRRRRRWRRWAAGRVWLLHNPRVDAVRDFPEQWQVVAAEAG